MQAGRFGDEYNGKAVASRMSLAAANFIRSVRTAGEKSFQCFGVMGAAHVIAEQDHPAFEIARLPCMEKSVCRSQCEDIA